MNIELSEKIKEYPYRISLLRQGLDMEKVFKKFGLTLQINHSNSMCIVSYICWLAANESNDIAVYFYSQRYSSFFDQSTLGFKSHKKFIEFKKCLNDYK